VITTDYQTTWRYNPEDSHLKIRNILKVKGKKLLTFVMKGRNWKTADHTLIIKMVMAIIAVNNEDSLDTETANS
jgi:hypothetical protein